MARRVVERSLQRPAKPRFYERVPRFNGVESPFVALPAEPDSARPHLADPAWTLHEAAKLQTRAVTWPRPYESGRDQLYRELAREQAAARATAQAAPASPEASA